MITLPPRPTLFPYTTLFRSLSPYTTLFRSQAEDGIRDHCVTGVQTCALPIDRKSTRLNSSHTVISYAVFCLTGVQTCALPIDRKSTRLNSSHTVISYAVFCLKKKKQNSATEGGNDRQPNRLLAHGYGRIGFQSLPATGKQAVLRAWSAEESLTSIVQTTSRMS